MKAKHLKHIVIACIVAWYAWWGLVQVTQWISNEAALDRAQQIQIEVWDKQLEQYRIDHGAGALERLKR